jgi:hypothetical protein
MKYGLTVIISLLLFSSTVFPQASDTDTAVIFKGINNKIAYSKTRKLNETYFIIINNSSKKIKVNAVKTELIRGNSTEQLSLMLIKDNQYPNGNSYIYLNPRTEKKIRIKFNPVDLFEGSTYTIRATISVDGKEYVALSVTGLFRQAYGDKNKLKNNHGP